jgi:hypothetical protein
MFTSKTRIPFQSNQTVAGALGMPNLPAGGEVVILFNSTVAFGPRSATHYQCHFFDVSIDIDQNTDNTVKLQYSQDGGVTFIDAENTGTTISNADQDSVRAVRFSVDLYQDWRVVWTNGSVNQGVFNVNMGIDHCSRGSVLKSVNEA